MRSFWSRNCIAQPVCRFQWPRKVDDDGILHTPLSPQRPPFPLSSHSFPVRRSDSSPLFTPIHYDNGILSTPHFSMRLPQYSPTFLRLSGSSLRRSQALSGAWSHLRRLLPRPSLVWQPRHLGCIPFPFLLSSLPRFMSLLLFLFLLSSSPLCRRFSRPFTLFSLPLTGHPCSVLADIACHYVSHYLYVSETHSMCQTYM